MGCDINLIFEKKVDGKWERIVIPDGLEPDDRNYKVFGFLAGVYDHDFEGYFQDRGLPEDKSFDTEKDYLGEFGFTHATLYEILQLPWEKYGLGECYFYTFCQYVLPRLISWCGSLSVQDEMNVRVLMGFDN